ncbi:MAG: hypothetical protein M2R45_02447 [Verrucomicrobia subdivision 3 bacterium]|nr:hypothetical protein [Limisphaerales bacterium]MCS1416348.1 hypothetical protein [Limisphaerales bacterium]
MSQERNRSLHPEKTRRYRAHAISDSTQGKSHSTCNSASHGFATVSGANRGLLGGDSEEAYEELINRLLDSDHYGERQAMFWLDLTCYGETERLHHDRRHDM